MLENIIRAKWEKTMVNAIKWLYVDMKEEASLAHSL